MASSRFTHPKNTNSDREEPISQTKILQRFLDEHKGYQFVQHNGQRIFEPCPYLKLPSPPRGCEIFIGNIPKQVYEDRLIPLFETVGNIYKFRLMLDFNQKNRGECIFLLVGFYSKFFGYVYRFFFIYQVAHEIWLSKSLDAILVRLSFI